MLKIGQKNISKKTGGCCGVPIVSDLICCSASSKKVQQEIDRLKTKKDFKSLLT